MLILGSIILLSYYFLVCLSKVVQPGCHHSDCNVICVSVRLKSQWIDTAFTDKDSKLKKKALLRKQYEILNLAEPGKRNKQKKNKNKHWHLAQAILQIWRKLLSFCFFWQSPKRHRPHEWIWGLGGNEERSVQVQAVMCWLWHNRAESQFSAYTTTLLFRPNSPTAAVLGGK